MKSDIYVFFYLPGEFSPLPGWLVLCRNCFRLSDGCLFGCSWVHCAALVRIWHIYTSTMIHLRGVVVKRNKLYTFLMCCRNSRFFYSVGKGSAASLWFNHMLKESHTYCTARIFFCRRSIY